MRIDILIDTTLSKRIHWYIWQWTFIEFTRGLTISSVCCSTIVRVLFLFYLFIKYLVKEGEWKKTTIKLLFPLDFQYTQKNPMTDTHFHVRSTHLTVKSHGQDSKGHSLYSIENDYKYDYQQVSITEVTCAMLSTTMRSKRQSCSCALCIHVLHTHTYLHTLCSVFVYT